MARLRCAREDCIERSKWLEEMVEVHSRCRVLLMRGDEAEGKNVDSCVRTSGRTQAAFLPARNAAFRCI